MTRSLMVLAVLFFVALIVSLVVGFASSAPAMLIVGLMCAFPMFMLALGAAVGRASNELTIVRKERVAQQTVMRTERQQRRIPTPEILS